MIDPNQGSEEFYKNFSRQIQSLPLDLQGLVPDHLCYRVATRGEYIALKSYLEKENELLTEAEIRGRPIATFRLKVPMRFGDRLIELLELPAPKSESDFKTGFEHVEYVIEEPLETFRARHPHLGFELKKNPFNPELSLALDGIAVKFHYESLDRVIEKEKLPDKQRQMVVFDLDGTLIDSIEVIAKANRVVLSEFGADPKRLEQMPNKEFGSTYQKLLAQFDLHGVDVNEFARRWGEEMMRHKIELFDGVSETLEQLKRDRIPMALWTAREPVSTQKVLSDLKIESYFERVLCFGHTYSKPSLEGFDFLVQGRPKDFVISTGDSDTDHEAAQKVGCRFVWANRLTDLIDQLRTP